MYIRNRVASVTLTDSNNVTTTLNQKSYDQYPSGITATNNIQQQDTADYGTNFTARGNAYYEQTPSLGWQSNYDQTGTKIWTGIDVNPNEYVSRLQSSTTNYAAPDQVTTGNALNTSMTWSSSLQSTGKTGPNSDTTTVQYDQSDRPSNIASPYGAQTTYSYSVNAPQITATTNAHWVKTYLDGLGRTAQMQRGDSGSVQSVQKFVYDSCGCSPMGKVVSKTMPYTPGATSVSTVYTFDALGRMLTSTKPDGHSTTSYFYTGIAVTVTDPTGKWKKIVRDAFGELIEVDEPSPNPASEPNHVTTYSYDVFGHLTQVQMSRTIGGQVRTQTRSWTYDSQTLRLSSKTSPEAGTVQYTYNTDNTVATVTDAKNQRTVYSYDTYGRVVQIARGTVSNGTFTEDQTQRVTYAYDGANSGYSAATNGRVSQVNYQGPHGLSFAELFSYTTPGQVSKKRLQISGSDVGTNPINMDAGYTYDNEGHTLSIGYPSSTVNSDGTTASGPTYSYSRDSMGRLQRMSDQSNYAWVSSASYGPSNELLQLQTSAFTETRTYNANLQMIELVSGTNVHWVYNYSATQNNGQILSAQDVVSGETITYQYDSLKRMIQASATGDPSGSWSQIMTFDGFGNLTSKSSSNAPGLSIAVDPATNHIITGASYDANGNLTGYSGDAYGYDLRNRMIQANPASGGTFLYGYDSTNHRIYKGSYSNGTYSAEEIYFYGVEGHKYGTWQVNPSSGVVLQATVTKQWFGRRLLQPQDRLGSRGKYFAFGEERTNISPANPPNDQEKFATYTRDSATGLDYANQRLYSSTLGRFTRPDPFGGSGQAGAPQSWNRYSYVSNDPANRFDPEGLDDDDGDFGNYTELYGGYEGQSVGGCDACSADSLSEPYVPLATTSTANGAVLTGTTLDTYTISDTSSCPPNCTTDLPTPIESAITSQQGYDFQQLLINTYNFTKNTDFLNSYLGNSVPDFIESNGFGEAKAGAYVYRSTQLQRMIAGLSGGQSLNLYISELTRYSQPLLTAIQNTGGNIYRYVQGSLIEAEPVVEELLAPLEEGIIP